MLSTLIIGLMCLIVLAVAAIVLSLTYKLIRKILGV